MHGGTLVQISVTMEADADTAVNVRHAGNEGPLSVLEVSAPSGYQIGERIGHAVILARAQVVACEFTFREGWVVFTMRAVDFDGARLTARRIREICNLVARELCSLGGR